MNDLQISCRLQNVLQERDNGFKLEIPEFEIPLQNGDVGNKIPLMGISGAGKSTLLNMMAAIEWPKQGAISWSFPDEKNPQVSWGGQGPQTAEARILRRKLFGYAFQDSTLMEHLKIGENLCYPLLLKGFTQQQAVEEAKKSLTTVLIGDEKQKLDDFFERYPFQLSGGQRQRIALVQAMVHDPYVLFADEPTGSLDLSTRQEVMKVLYDWVDEEGYQGKRLLLWVTHHEDDPGNAGVRKFLYIQPGQTPDWKDVEEPNPRPLP